jgi:hypothetical protein
MFSLEFAGLSLFNITFVLSVPVCSHFLKDCIDTVPYRVYCRFVPTTVTICFYLYRIRKQSGSRIKSMGRLIKNKFLFKLTLTSTA